MIKPEEKKANESMLVTQSNQLVEAKYYLSLSEQRLVLMLASMVEPDDKDFKTYAIKITDFKDLIGLKSKNLHGRVKLLLKSLAGRVIEIPKSGKNYLITGWISDAEYFDDAGIVQLSFSAKLKPYLIALKSEFTSHKLGIAIKFKGAYTIRIYTLLKQYQKLGERKFTLNEFREILGIEVDKFLLFSNLKARTILQAQKEFSRQDKNGAYFSDINFTFEAIKTGRKITGLKFNIFSQSINSIFVPEIVPAQQEQPQDETIIKLVEIGIVKVKAESYLSKYGADYINEKIDLLIADMKTGQVKSPAGYLNNAIIQNWTSEKIAKKKVLEDKQKKEWEARLEEDRKNKILDERKKIGNEFKTKAIADFLVEKSEKEREEFLLEIKKNAGAFVGGMINDLSHSIAISEIIKLIPNFFENQKEYIKQNLNM